MPFKDKLKWKEGNKGKMALGATALILTDFGLLAGWIASAGKHTTQSHNFGMSCMVFGFITLLLLSAVVCSNGDTKSNFKGYMLAITSTVVCPMVFGIIAVTKPSVAHMDIVVSQTMGGSALFAMGGLFLLAMYTICRSSAYTNNTSGRRIAGAIAVSIFGVSTCVVLQASQIGVASHIPIAMSVMFAIGFLAILAKCTTAAIDKKTGFTSVLGTISSVGLIGIGIGSGAFSLSSSIANGNIATPALIVMGVFIGVGLSLCIVQRKLQCCNKPGNDGINL